MLKTLPRLLRYTYCKGCGIALPAAVQDDYHASCRRPIGNRA